MPTTRATLQLVTAAALVLAADSAVLPPRALIRAPPQISPISLCAPTGVQTLQLDVPGTYVIRMFIFDGEKNSVEAIYVMEVGADNLAPEADAGPDQATTVGQLATFDGSDSYDPEGDLQVYRWLLEEAPPGSEQDSGNIFGADSDSAQFVPDVPGIYVFSLEVRDEFTWSNKDFVSLVVPTDNELRIRLRSYFHQCRPKQSNWLE